MHTSSTCIWAWLTLTDGLIMNCKLFSWPLVEQWRIATNSQRTRRRPLPLGKVQRLCDDITCLCIGVKPALLLDYVVNIDLQSLEELVKLWKDGERLKVFTLNGDYFILNEIAFDKDHYASLFIDISQTNAQPYISESLEIGSLIKKQVKEFIDITKLKESSILHNQSTTLPHSLNYCAMYGWLLGYPLIYYWNIHNENSNTLDVVQCKVTIASDLLLEKVSE